jgi:phosphoserine phosphatase
MNDEIGYAESLRERAALLEGLSEADAAAAYDEVELREGAASLIRSLNEAGVTTAILTGGFERGVEVALERECVTVDHIVSNRLPMADGALTGEVEGPLIEGTKDTALEELADLVDADLKETVAVGDGANDLDMLNTAGLGIAFNAKPIVRQAADTAVSVPYLDAILFLLGITREEIEAADAEDPDFEVRPVLPIPEDPCGELAGHGPPT